MQIFVFAGKPKLFNGLCSHCFFQFLKVNLKYQTFSTVLIFFIHKGGGF